MGPKFRVLSLGGERIVRATDAKEVGVRDPAEENVPPPGPN